MYKKGFKIRSVVSSLKKGNAIFQACKQADISVTTLWSWRKKDPRIDRMITAAMESRVQMVEDALFQSALKGVPAAQIFFLKNRNPERWKDNRLAINNQIKVEQTNNNGDKPRGQFDGDAAERSGRLGEYLRNSLKQL